MSVTLVINPGNVSRKYALYVTGAPIIKWEAEVAGKGYQLCTHRIGTPLVCESLSQEDFSSIFTRIAHEVRAYTETEKVTLSAVVVRVVAPGTALQKHAVVDMKYLQTLQAREAASPLHIPAVVRAIQNTQHHFPDTPTIAASDSAFHATMPAAARQYSLPVALAAEHDIYRFGFHGLSVSSIVNRVHAIVGQDPKKLIVCHLGDGMSVTAVQNSKSVDTTMGFSAATGLPMGSRGGDIDATALLEVMRAKHLKPTEAELFLTSACGLSGLAGEVDLRSVLARRAVDDNAATVAVEHLVRSVSKSIAGMTAVLGGVDAIVFTASAGVRSSELRMMICKKLSHLGVKISEARNQVTISKDGVISEHNSPVKVVVMRTDEMGEMAAVAEFVLALPKTQSNK